VSLEQEGLYEGAQDDKNHVNEQVALKRGNIRALVVYSRSGWVHVQHLLRTDSDRNQCQN
jgi:hypothetical protein